MDFGPFGLSEVVFIGLLALVIFGPRRLPELARSLGAALTTLRRGTEDLKRTFQEELEAADGGLTRDVREAARSLRSASEDVRSIGRSAAAEGRRLLSAETKTSGGTGAQGTSPRPGSSRPEPPADAAESSRDSKEPSVVDAPADPRTGPRAEADASADPTSGPRDEAADER